MLNIPDPVKDLFKLDSCRKNFRVHFPNGEMNDLTNNDVVQESVEFSESICSQNTFKFGLSESSTIEFETVGVGNMMGMKIDCGIEVDCTSLTAAQVSAIEAGSWDGYYKSANESDIGYSFFHVPYGLFVVRSCPRDHQAMTHRKVTAYTETRALTTDYQTALLDANGFEKKYTPKFKNMFYAAAGRNNEALLLDSGYTKEFSRILGSFENDLFERIVTFHVSGNPFYVKIAVGLYDVPIYSGPVNYFDYGYTTDAVYGLEGLENFKNHNLVDSIASVLVSDYGVSESEAYDLEFYDHVAIPPIGPDYFAKPSCPKVINIFGVETKNRVAYYTKIKKIDLADISGLYLINPDREGVVTFVSVISHIIAVPWSSYDIESGHATGDPIEAYAQGLNAAHVNQYVAPSGTDFGLELSLSYTGKDKPSSFSIHDEYSFSGAVDSSKISIDYLEVNALFAAQNRLGGYKFFNLDDTADATLLPAEYSHFWWDEYDVSPIGKIKYVYKKKDKEETLIYDFGDGQSMYDMTANDFFNQLQKSQSEIESILSSSFVPHAGGVAFTPIELTIGNGLPYIEAGDCIEAEAEDGAVAKSYVLTQRISGIQHLVQSIESSGGNLTGTAYGEGN